jgi:hypothetical protein
MNRVPSGTGSERFRSTAAADVVDLGMTRIPKVRLEEL